MTIDCLRWQRFLAAPLTLLLVLGGWTAIAAGAARLGSFESLVVVAPGSGFLERLPPDIALTGGGRHFLVLRADRPGFAEALYAAGARVVLPARKGGCIALLQDRPGSS